MNLETTSLLSEDTNKQALDRFSSNNVKWRNTSCKYNKKNCFDSYVHAPIDKFGVVGRWLRHKLLDGILVGTPVILTIQKHRTPLRTIIMKIFSFLGTEDFYTMLFLCCMWSFDARLGRLFGVLMWVGFYTTGFLKTLFCLPRPPCPPVVPLEKAFDWALPSHHSLLGVILPWYIWLYTTLHFELSTFAMSVICCLIVVWSFGVLLSRLYLGVHSPADIVCGGVVGVIVLSLWMQVDDYVDFYISQQRLEPQLRLMALLTFLLCIHPITERGNPSFLDTCILHGVFCGIILGRSQRSRLVGMPSLLETFDGLSLLTFAKLSVLRLLIGGAVVLLLRVILKMIFIILFEFLYRLGGLPSFNSSKYRKQMPPNPKHYTNQFKLPPIYEIEIKADRSDGNESSTSEGSDIENDDVVTRSSNSSPKWYNFIQICNAISSLSRKSNNEPWDVTVPVKLIVYTIITYCAVEVVPHFFIALEI